MAPPSYPTPQFLIATNPYTPTATLAQAIMQASPLLTELVVVREWLHETARFDPGPGSSTGYWKFTKYQLLQNARMGKGKQRDSGIVSEMDPDAPTREGVVLAADDAVSCSAFSPFSVYSRGCRHMTKPLYKHCILVFVPDDWMKRESYVGEHINRGELQAYVDHCCFNGKPFVSGVYWHLTFCSTCNSQRAARRRCYGRWRDGRMAG